MSKEIRTKLKDVEYDFNGSFMGESNLPCELLLLLDLLMNGSSHDGHDESGFSLSVKTLAQIIFYNHRKRQRKDSIGGGYQRHNTDKESPFLLYIGLKIYASTRSSEIIDILHKHGLCVSYDRILRITQGLGEAALQLFEDEDAIIPGLLRHGLFTIGAKDNVDKNARCTVSKSHYHGTSMSLFQFPSSFNEGFGRNYQKFVKVSSSESKKVRELPYFYANVEEIPDPPKDYYASVSTVNIPEAVSQSYLVNAELDKELKWLDYIANLKVFNPDSSYSVYFARNYESKTDISSSIDTARYQIFKYRGNSDIRSLPPTKDALVHHIHRAAYVAGYIWGRSHIPIKTEEPTTNWKWVVKDEKLKCKWVSYDHGSATDSLGNTVFKKCGCRKGCKKSCKCKKGDEMKCLPTCKCRGKCGEI